MKSTAGPLAPPHAAGAASRLVALAAALLLLALSVCLSLFCAAMKDYVEAHAGELYREWGGLVLVALAVLPVPSLFVLDHRWLAP
jgi:hypothetical protein